MEDQTQIPQLSSEVPNSTTAALLEESRVQIEVGNYYHCDSNKDALDFLAKELNRTPAVA